LTFPKYELFIEYYLHEGLRAAVSAGHAEREPGPVIENIGSSGKTTAYHRDPGKKKYIKRR
jgi:hypothetical protein